MAMFGEGSNVIVRYSTNNESRNKLTNTEEIMENWKDYKKFYGESKLIDTQNWPKRVLYSVTFKEAVNTGGRSSFTDFIYLHTSARMQIGDTGLIDYVLKKRSKARPGRRLSRKTFHNCSWACDAYQYETFLWLCLEKASMLTNNKFKNKLTSAEEIMDKWKDYNKFYGKSKLIETHTKQERVCPKHRGGGPDNKYYNYRGVRQRRNRKWVAEIKEPKTGRRIWLGTHNVPHDAALAYDEAAIALYGSRAKPNLLKNPLSNYSCAQVSTVTEETVEDVEKDVPVLVGQESLSTNGGVRLNVEPEFDISDMEEILDFLNSSPGPVSEDNSNNVEYGKVGKAMGNIEQPTVDPLEQPYEFHNNPDTELLLENDTFHFHNNLDEELLLTKDTSGVDYDFDFSSDYDFLEPSRQGDFSSSFDEMNTMDFNSNVRGSNWL
ncbi:hypothetical protein OROHE_020028 [Orobanche hederae]